MLKCEEMSNPVLLPITGKTSRTQEKSILLGKAEHTAGSSSPH
jgi:hypothetical protein